MTEVADLQFWAVLKVQPLNYLRKILAPNWYRVCSEPNGVVASKTEMSNNKFGNECGRNTKGFRM